MKNDSIYQVVTRDEFGDVISSTQGLTKYEYFLGKIISGLSSKENMSDSYIAFRAIEITNELFIQLNPKPKKVKKEKKK